MKLTLTFEIETDDDGQKKYLELWPDFAPETTEATLIREAVATWEYEGLVIGPVLVNGKAVE